MQLLLSVTEMQYVTGFILTTILTVYPIPLSPPTIGGLLMLSGAAPAAYTTRYFWRLKQNIGVIWLLLLTLTLMTRAVTEGLMVVTHSQQASITLLHVSRVLGMASSLFTLYFILEYSIGRTLNTQVLLTISTPIIAVTTTFILIPNKFITVTGFTKGVPQWEYTHTWGLVFVVVITVLIILTIGILVRDWLVTTGTKNKQVTLILTALLIGVTGAYLQITGFTPTYFNPIIHGYILSLVLIAYGINKYGLFTTHSIGHKKMFETIDDGIITLHSNGNVIDCNSAGQEICSLANPQKATIEEIIETHPKIQNIVNTDNPAKTETVTTNNKSYSVTASSVTFGRGHTGTVLHLQDITERREREQRLDTVRQILSRVFRHNISNKLTVILGHVDVLENRLPTDTKSDTEDSELPYDTEKITSAIDCIKRSTQDLETQANKTRQLETIIQPTNDLVTRDLVRVTTKTVEELEEQYGRKTKMKTPREALVKVHEEFELFIQNAVENAFEHTKNANVAIEITVNNETDEVILTISDDGSGIPETEQQAIESGEETQLVHSSGIGLWLMKAIVQESNGEFELTTDGTGTTITAILDQE